MPEAVQGETVLAAIGQPWRSFSSSGIQFENAAFEACTIALQRIVFQHNEAKSPWLFVVAVGLC
jgi:hypothetical protein